jgi:hypothetical protein
VDPSGVPMASRFDAQAPATCLSTESVPVPLAACRSGAVGSGGVGGLLRVPRRDAWRGGTVVDPLGVSKASRFDEERFADA